MNTTLLIMAAGIGSRFGTGIKQLEPVDDANHIIMDYSIHDAIEAGFNHVIFIIRKNIEKEFKEAIGDRIAAICSSHNVTVDYAFQDINDIPGEIPTGRTKPWGTGQAVLAAKSVIKTPFIVINADDYYGKEGFKAVYEYLVNGGKSCMAGFVLKNTLSDNGGVTRGICKMDENGNLTEVVCSVFITVFHNLHGISALLWITFSICILHILPNADLNLFMYPYFLFGYCLNRFQIKQCRYKYVVFVLYFVMLMFYSKKHFIYITGNRLFGDAHLVLEQFGNILFRYTIGMCGCVVAAYIFRALYHITTKTMVGSRIIMIGKYSMQIYICQHFLLEHMGGKVYNLITQELQYNFLASNRVLFDLVLCPLIAICLCVLIIYICKWLETNTRLSRILFGR